jgi:hypothetical protein
MPNTNIIFSETNVVYLHWVECLRPVGIALGQKLELLRVLVVPKLKGLCQEMCIV